MNHQEPCYCDAYPFPHRLGGGMCEATGDTRCPHCDSIVDDDAVEWVKTIEATYYQPAEYAPHLVGVCGHCG